MSIEARMKKIVSEQFDVCFADVQLKSSFIEDLGADSLDEVELVMAIEDEFEIDIDDEKAEAIKTVQQAIDYLTSAGVQ